MPGGILNWSRAEQPKSRARNDAFPYLADDLQRTVAEHRRRSLRHGGALVFGAHETPPADLLEPWLPARGVWRRADVA